VIEELIMVPTEDSSVSLSLESALAIEHASRQQQLVDFVAASSLFLSTGLQISLKMLNVFGSKLAIIFLCFSSIVWVVFEKTNSSKRIFAYEKKFRFISLLKSAIKKHSLFLMILYEKF